ncbi:MAG: 3-deoxy-manno-octulosonate cytidylyltransferase [Opitutales bacterium]
MSAGAQLSIVVPARLASQRFPRKLLAPVLGKPLILWTAEAIQRAQPELPLWFAVGDSELAEMLTAEGYRIIQTDPDLASGTDRLAVANREIGAEAILNVQADEPLVSRKQIEALAALLENPGVEMATLATPFESVEAFKDVNNVKVVRDETGRALYFSRASIPYPRGHYAELTPDTLHANGCLHHLGLYAYRASLLEAFSSWPPGRLEQVEKLEQLRALERGIPIAVGVVDERTLGVDTPEDLPRLEALLQARSGDLDT